MAGRLFAVVGPSGAGKDTLMQAAARQRPDLGLVRRVITRPEAAGGEAFEGVGEAAFSRRLAAGDFALDWNAHGLRYGIPRSVRNDLAAGADILFNGSRDGLDRAWRLFPDLTAILVTASTPVLAQRLAARGRESAADIARRLDRARDVVPKGPRVRVVENDGTLEVAVAAFLAALQPDSV